MERAQPSDAVSAAELLDAAARRQESIGHRQWTPGTFGDEVRRAVSCGDLYVARRRGVVIGCFILDGGSPRLIRWLAEHGREPTDGCNVGRLAVAVAASGQGVGIELLDAARVLAARRGLAHLWLDCPAENTRLVRYYVDAGFAYCGDNDIPGPNGEPWVSSVFERSTGVRFPT